MKDVLVQRSNCGERAMRIELTSRAWEARVITIIRRPQMTYFVVNKLPLLIHKSKV